MQQPHFNPKYRIPEPEEITRYCSSLVVRMPTKGGQRKEYIEDAELQPAHFSVKEYLVSNRLPKKVEEDMQDSIVRFSVVKVCLAYLLNIDQGIRVKRVLKDFPLARYSAMFWAKNMQDTACGEDEILSLVAEVKDDKAGEDV